MTGAFCKTKGEFDMPESVSRPFARKIYMPFTLIELLIVVAVMIILISLLMPALFGARKAAKSIVCVSNLKQIGIASIAYTIDNNDWVVQRAGSPSVNVNGIYFPPNCVTYLAQYMGGSSEYSDITTSWVSANKYDIAISRWHMKMWRCSACVRPIDGGSSPHPFGTCYGMNYQLSYLGNPSWVVQATYYGSMPRRMSGINVRTYVFSDDTTNLTYHNSGPAGRIVGDLNSFGNPGLSCWAVEGTLPSAHPGVSMKFLIIDGAVESFNASSCKAAFSQSGNRIIPY